MLKNIALSWIITLPITWFIAWITFLLLNTFIG
jgi:phosphate/sulfate permease